MEYRLREYSIYEAGQRRDRQGNPHQEDAIYPPYGSDGNDSRLFIVCDGMGGHDAGEVASATVCDTISGTLTGATAERQRPYDTAALQRAIGAAYDALDRRDTGTERKMGTTLALLQLHDDGYAAVHIGDSRIYHIRPGKTADDTRIIFRTEDHSLVNYLIRKGQMTLEESLTSPKRHIITRALQPNMERRSQAEVHLSADILAGDYFMVCSDGIYENLDDEYLCYLFSHDGGSDKNKVAQLTKATANNADNHSAIIVHITDVLSGSPAKAETSSPSACTATESRPTNPLPMSNKAQAMNDKKTEPQKKTRQKIAGLPAGDDAMELAVKFIFILMGIVVAIMLVYYLFIRENEDLQRAGTAVDIIQQETSPGSESYGYEITEQDIHNQAHEIAPEPAEPTDEVVTDDADVEAEPIEEATPQPSPSTQDEPIIQE